MLKLLFGFLLDRITSPFLSLPFFFFWQVIAKCLSEEETAGLKEMFKTVDSGQITYEELRAGLKRVGANLKESEILVITPW